MFFYVNKIEILCSAGDSDLIKLSYTQYYTCVTQRFKLIFFLKKFKFYFVFFNNYHNL